MATSKREVSFKVRTAKETDLIRRIALRAVAAAQRASIFNYSATDAAMDITACHVNGCPLDLERLLNADDFNFSHDIFGINRHLNHETGKLENHFRPRHCQRSAA